VAVGGTVEFEFGRSRPRKVTGAVFVSGDADQPAPAAAERLHRLEAQMDVDGAELALAADRVPAARLGVLRDVIQDERADSPAP
jgi:hypothetical protein